MADTISDKLVRLNEVKQQIKQSIIDKGVAVADTDPFSAYAGKIQQISGGGAPATKFGMSIDNLLGDVDESGVLTAPKEPFVFDGTGITAFNYAAMQGRFGSDNVAGPIPVTKILLPDLLSVLGTVEKFAENATMLTEVDIRNLRSFSAGDTFSSSAWASAFRNCTSLSVLRADNVADISTSYACQQMFSGCVSLKSTGLPNLAIISGGGACQYMYADCVFEELGLDNLTTISGSSSCSYMFHRLTIDEATFPKLSTISGSSCSYWFRSSSVKRVCFPALVNVVTNAFGTSASTAAFYGCSQLTEIHFRADAQATIEAMSQYANKWGATNATIYFDL